ncbi:hypothetical protein RBB75_18120 [Tunturibacter empetritectus]|uniref:SRPBCC family protein n=1 Tax=Tunturiibacter empetritectus TaxID=3069691 RepID=A0AAU7ZBK7_9BACT
MIFSHEAPIPLPVNSIRLDEWLFHLSEKEYMACARGHRAIGTNGGDHFDGMVNVESMAGALLIQHYRTKQLEADYVKLFSERSRGYLMHLLPFTLQVGWEMQVSSVSAEESKLHCTIDVMNPPWIRFAGFFNATNYWIHRHLIEETNGFARDLTQKGGK